MIFVSSCVFRGNQVSRFIGGSPEAPRNGKSTKEAAVSFSVDLGADRRQFQHLSFRHSPTPFLWFVDFCASLCFSWQALMFYPLLDSEFLVCDTARFSD
jgi:hypothetical protein